MTHDVKALALSTLKDLAKPLRRLRVLYWGGSGRGFPGGDGPVEAVDLLNSVGLHFVYTHAGDPDEAEKLNAEYDVAIVTNTRIGLLLEAPARLWDCAARRAWWHWDLRPGHVGAPLRGRVDRVFLTYDGPWTAPDGAVYDPPQWAQALGVPVSYCPQASPLRSPTPAPGGARVVFVGDLANRTYHRGRAELCRALGAEVLNARARDGRLAIEARLPTVYPSARYCLSASPLAPGYTSVRTYSILACGGLLLLHRFPDSERLFADGEHAVLFDTADEAVERIAALDADSTARAAIARAGRELHASRHTTAHHVASICREMLGVSDGFSGWL